MVKLKVKKQTYRNVFALLAAVALVFIVVFSIPNVFLALTLILLWTMIMAVAIIPRGK